MTRRNFPNAIKLAAWNRCGGICECGCGQKIIRAEYDHIVPDALGGDPTLENCQVIDARCHRIKTSTVDVPAVAKGERIERKRAGLWRSRPMQGGRKSALKKRMDGTVIMRV